MMPLPARPSIQKSADGAGKRSQNALVARALSIFCTSILVVVVTIGPRRLAAQDEPIEDQQHEREELGVNAYTAPSIARILAELDALKPLSFDQLKRDLPATSAATREQKGLIFGGLIADGFLIVETERKNRIEDLGRALMREARGLGVAEQVLRHSASLTDLGRRGNWTAMREELIATQNEVEQAMVELRDEKLAELISLGGWLRGLEISSGAVELSFSPQRAKLLVQPDLVDYFTAELKTLPPDVIHLPFFDKIRAGVGEIAPLLKKTGALTIVDVKKVHAQARELNTLIRQIR
jgi:hypothetical protein